MFTINGVLWRVIIVSPNHPELRQPNGKYAVGCCNTTNHTIYIASNLPVEQYREVLYHEVAHAAINSYNILLPLDEEERMVSFISTHGDEIVVIVDQFI